MNYFAKFRYNKIFFLKFFLYFFIQEIFQINGVLGYFISQYKKYFDIFHTYATLRSYIFVRDSFMCGIFV